ncbi:MAG: RNA polymerase sigma factor [Candidatus Doudnabacteria bacterium]
MQELTDHQVIALAKKGDNAALETLVSRYLKLVYFFVYSYVKNSAIAEDVSQEVFIKLWKNLSKFDSSKEFRPWLYQIAKNTCLDYLKKKQTLNFAEFESVDGEQWLAQTIPDSAPGPALVTERALLGEQLMSALKQLSPKYAEIISQYHLEDLNFRQIAEKGRFSINTAKSRYRRAIAQLKEIWPINAPKK